MAAPGKVPSVTLCGKRASESVRAYMRAWHGWHKQPWTARLQATMDAIQCVQRAASPMKKVGVPRNRLRGCWAALTCRPPRTQRLACTSLLALSCADTTQLHIQAQRSHSPALWHWFPRLEKRGAPRELKAPRQVALWLPVQARAPTAPAPAPPATHILPHTARKPNVRFESMALMKPVQLKDSSPADARPTPNMMGSSVITTGKGVACRGRGEQAEAPQH